MERVKTATLRSTLLCAIAALQFAQLQGLVIASEMSDGIAAQAAMAVAALVIPYLATYIAFKEYKQRTRNVGFAVLR